MTFRSWGRHRLDQTTDDLIGVDAVRLGLEVQQHAMPQDRQRHRPDVVERRYGTAVEQRACFRAEHERLSGPRSRAPLHEFADDRRYEIIVISGWPGRAHEPERVLDDV